MTTVIRPASLVVAQDGADFLSNRKRSDKQTERRVLDPDIQFHERLEVAEFDVHLLFYFPPNQSKVVRTRLAIEPTGFVCACRSTRPSSKQHSCLLTTRPLRVCLRPFSPLWNKLEVPRRWFFSCMCGLYQHITSSPSLL